MPPKRLLPLLAAMALAIAAPARADLVLSLTPEGTLTPGGTIAVDIRVSDLPGPLPLFFYDLTFVVSGQPVPPSFVVPSLASSLIDDKDYVFFGDSASISNYPGQVSDSPNGKSTQVEVTDFTASGNDAPLSSSTLLSRVFLHLADQALPPSGETLILSVTAADLESSSGVYTISGPLPTITIKAVPEPASLLLLAAGATAAAFSRWRPRSHTSRPTP